MSERERGKVFTGNVKSKDVSFDKNLQFMCAAVYKSLQLLSSELTGSTVQIVMGLYMLISVIVMIHKAGGEHYAYRCRHSLLF